MKLKLCGNLKLADELELLLKACLWTGPTSIEAFKSWNRSVDLENIDSASTRLFPLLYANLRKQQFEDPRLPMFKGVYRKNWYRQQLLLKEALPVLKTLQELQIPCMLLKGAALQSCFYEGPGLRPMDDLDIVVPEPRMRDAIGVFKSIGWNPYPCWSEDLLQIKHAQGFLSPNRMAVDLHWHVLNSDIRTGVDNEFWSGAVPLVLEGVKTLTLNPTDHLLHACAHGENPSGTIAPVRWIADCMMILKKEGAAIDWNRFATLAAKHRLVPAMKDSLNFLSHLFQAPVPPEVLEKLENIPISARQRFSRFFKTSTSGNRFALAGSTLENYFRYESGFWKARGISGLTDYLRVLWNLDSRRQVFSRSLNRTMRHLKRG